LARRAMEEEGGWESVSQFHRIDQNAPAPRNVSRETNHRSLAIDSRAGGAPPQDRQGNSRKFNAKNLQKRNRRPPPHLRSPIRVRSMPRRNRVESRARSWRNLHQCFSVLPGDRFRTDRNTSENARRPSVRVTKKAGARQEPSV